MQMVSSIKVEPKPQMLFPGVSEGQSVKPKKQLLGQVVSGKVDKVHMLSQYL